MTEAHNNIQKKKIIIPAKIAFVSAMIAVLCWYVLFNASFYSISMLVKYGALILGIIFSGVAFILSLIHLLGKSNQRNMLDMIFSTLSIVISVIIFVLIVQWGTSYWIAAKRGNNTIRCARNLWELGVAIRAYAEEDEDNQYPAPNNWCDLLIKYADVQEKQFICKMAKEAGNTERSHYAMNPNCEPNSPNDIVLLFETKGGWNQFGGVEILTTENHEGKRCNILFNNGSTTFTRKEDLSELKWNNDQKKAR